MPVMFAYDRWDAYIIYHDGLWVGSLTHGTGAAYSAGRMRVIQDTARAQNALKADESVLLPLPGELYHKCANEFKKKL